MADSTGNDNSLENWDLIGQENRALFMDFLYDIHGRENGLYTGLWEQFKEMSAPLVSDLICINLRREQDTDVVSDD